MPPAPLSRGVHPSFALKVSKGGSRCLQRDMHMLADKAATKRWLKRVRQQMREEDVDFGLF